MLSQEKQLKIIADVMGGLPYEYKVTDFYGWKLVTMEHSFDFRNNEYRRMDLLLSQKDVPKINKLEQLYLAYIKNISYIKKVDFYKNHLIKN